MHIRARGRADPCGNEASMLMEIQGLHTAYNAYGVYNAQCNQDTFTSAITLPVTLGSSAIPPYRGRPLAPLHAHRRQSSGSRLFRRRRRARHAAAPVVGDRERAIFGHVSPRRARGAGAEPEAAAAAAHSRGSRSAAGDGGAQVGGAPLQCRLAAVLVSHCLCKNYASLNLARQRLETACTFLRWWMRRQSKPQSTEQLKPDRPERYVFAHFGS